MKRPRASATARLFNRDGGGALSLIAVELHAEKARPCPAFQRQGGISLSYAGASFTDSPPSSPTGSPPAGTRPLEYQNAIAKSWDGPALDAGESRVMVEQITIAYTAMEIVDV